MCTDSWPIFELSELLLLSELRESELAFFELLCSVLRSSALPLFSILGSKTVSTISTFVVMTFLHWVLFTDTRRYYLLGSVNNQYGNFRYNE